jgi:hypothetical protein
MTRFRIYVGVLFISNPMTLLNRRPSLPKRGTEPDTRRGQSFERSIASLSALEVPQLKVGSVFRMPNALLRRIVESLDVVPTGSELANCCHFSHGVSPFSEPCGRSDCSDPAKPVGPHSGQPHSDLRLRKTPLSRFAAIVRLCR